MSIFYDTVSIPPDVLFHGTARKNVSSIRKWGINKGEQHAVHLSRDAVMASKVGARHGKPTVLTIAAKEMSDDGFKFYLSDNFVWLTEHVPSKYITFQK